MKKIEIVLIGLLVIIGIVAYGYYYFLAYKAVKEDVIPSLSTAIESEINTDSNDNEMQTKEEVTSVVVEKEAPSKSDTNIKTDINNFAEGKNHIMYISSKKGAADGSSARHDLEEELITFLKKLSDGDVDGGGVWIPTMQWEIFIYDIKKKDTVMQIIDFIKGKEIAKDIGDISIRRHDDKYEYSNNLWNS